MYKNLVFLFLGCLFIACKAKQSEQSVVTDTRKIIYPVNIDLGDLNTENEPLKLSEIAKEVRYVPLNSDSIVSRITDFHVADSFIFIEQAGRISSFMQSGRFIKHFPPNGRGPGEDYARCMTVNEKDRILYVFGNYTHKIIPFSYEGEWLKTSIPNRFHENVSALYAMGNKLFSITADLSILKDKSISLGMNTEDGSIFFRYRNPHIPPSVQDEKRIRGQFYGFELVSYQCYQDSLTLFRDSYNDTLYQTVDFKTISPRYIFARDRSRVSYMAMLEAMGTLKMDNIKNKYTLDKVLETSSFLFFRITDYFGCKFGIYKKDRQEVRVFKEMIIQNDMDGGPDFTTYCDRSSQWVYKDKLYNLIWPIALLDSKSDKTQSEAVVKLKKNIKEEDNPILMIVTLK